MRLRLVTASVVAPLLVLVLALAGGWWASGRSADGRASLASALDALPSDTQVAGFTDWAQVRRELGVGLASDAAGRAALADDASLRDLSTRSVLGQSTEEMHDAFGWSAADLDWEVYGQAADGATMVGRLDASVSFAAVREQLVDLGYEQEGRIWTIAADADSAVGQELASILRSIVLVPRGRLVLAADRPTYAATVLRTIDREAPSLLSERGAAGVAAALVGSDTALVQSGDLVCRSTTPDGQDTTVQDQARAAADRAGGLVEPTYAGRALDARGGSDQEMRFALAFRSPAQAASQLRTRTRLATGPFIGRSGRVEDSLDLVGSGVDGGVASLRFRHDPDVATYMTGDGPLLLAACAP